MYIFYFF